MDAHLETEDVEANKKLSIASKILIGGIIVVLIFIMVSIISITIDSGSGSTKQNVNTGSNSNTRTSNAGQANNNNEDTSVQGNNAAQDDGVLDSDTINATNNNNQDPIDNQIESDLPGELNSENLIDEENDELDQGILAIVDGCLTRKITGEPCDETFVRDDIIDYCNELETLYDRCYILSALMNSEIDYCDFVQDPGLSIKCVESLVG